MDGLVRARKLTALKIENAKPRKNDKGELVRTEIPDPGKPGLYLVVQPNGRKSWAVRYRRHCDPSPKKYTLTRFPSLAVAHKQAQKVLDDVAEGKDPATDKQVARRTARENSSDFIEGVARDYLNKNLRRKDGRPIRESTKR